MPGIYKSNYYIKKDNDGFEYAVRLGEVSWIFSCPDCPYVMTAFSKEAAETLSFVHRMKPTQEHINALYDSMIEKNLPPATLT